MTCTECDRPVQARGLCNTHYSRARRAWLDAGVDLFPARSEAAWPIRLRPAICRHRACIRPAFTRAVCPSHLVAMLAAGRRSSLSVPARRLTAVTAEMRAA